MTAEENYLALVDKLVRLRGRWSEHLETHTAAAANPAYAPVARNGSRAKARVIRGHLQELDFILKRNGPAVAQLVPKTAVRSPNQEGA